MSVDKKKATKPAPQPAPVVATVYTPDNDPAAFGKDYVPPTKVTP